MSTNHRSLDPAPLLAVAARGIEPIDSADSNKHWGDRPPARLLAERLGVTIRTVARWQAGRERMRERTADEVCTRLGLHPIEVWGIAGWNDMVREQREEQ